MRWLVIVFLIEEGNLRANEDQLAIQSLLDVLKNEGFKLLLHMRVIRSDF